MFAPAHPFSVPLTEIVPTKGPPLTFTGACHPGTLPAPEAPNPMFGFEFVQVNAAPAGVEVKFTVGIACPAQTTILATWVTEGFGFTEMVAVTGDPEQLLAEAITVYTTVPWVSRLFTKT